MRENRMRILFLLIMVVIIALLLTGCSDKNTPPDITIVQNCYEEYSEDIQIIVEYLSASGYEDVYITDSSGIMMADLNKIQINDPTVNNSICKIISNKAYYHINKDGNTISFLQWKGIRDIGCGIAYTINGIDMPEIEFATQLIPLFEDRWFYYVSDYNTWRSE